MNDERAFLSAILADPGDDMRKLVYADWLEERGDARAEFIRLQIDLTERKAEHKATWRMLTDDVKCERIEQIAKIEARCREIALGCDLRWLGWMTTVACKPIPAFVPSAVGSADNLPFSEPLVFHGRAVTFLSQYTICAADDEELAIDLGFLSLLPEERTDIDSRLWPFVCEFERIRGAFTIGRLLAALKVRDFQNPNMPNLNVSDCDWTGYQSHAYADEVHQDFTAQYMFHRTENGEPASAAYTYLKAYVEGGSLWYFLLHCIPRGDARLNSTFWLAMGRSPSGPRLIGMIAEGACHNVCD